MDWLYFTVYQALISLLLPVVLLRFLVRGIARPQYRHRLSERLGSVPKEVPTDAIWLHAVSVGEVNAAQPLIDYLLDHQDAPLLVSSATPTGAAQVKRVFGHRVAHMYVPIDVRVIVARTMRKLRPRALIIVETELWPNLITVAAASGVPVALVNLRISDQTFRRGKTVLPLCRKTLGKVTTFGVQTDVDAKRILELGAPRSRVQVTGNLKFDALDTGVKTVAAMLRERWGQSRPVILLASSHQGEELEFSRILKPLQNACPGLLTLIAPRHPERFDGVFKQLSDQGLAVIRRSQWPDRVTMQVEAVLIDSMGELLSFYAAADIAVVGGSFAVNGGHNILEPIRVGTATVFGPSMTNFREITRLVIEHDAGEQVQNFQQLATTLTKLLCDSDLRQMRVENGMRMLDVHRGALTQTVSCIEPLMDQSAD